MSRFAIFQLIGCYLLSGAASGQSRQIVDHPRLLRFPEALIQLPTVKDRHFELKSGPSLYLAEDHTLPLVEITLALRVGSFLDPLDKTGLAYLSGSQIRRGGADGLEAGEFDNRVDDLGARLNTLSGTTRSGATLSVPSWALSETLDLFLAMLSDPRFQTDRVASARSNLVESMANRNVDPIEILEREWQWLMYGERHFSSRSMTPDTLQAITEEDLHLFHQLYWRPEQMILAISGDFEPTELVADLETRFAHWPVSREPAGSIFWPPQAPAPSRPPGLYHYEMMTPQAKVIIGQRLPTLLDWTASERFAMEVLAEILGGEGAISRVAGRLRTAEGLVYRASVRLIPGDFWPGEIQIFFETEGRSVTRAVELAVEEVERIRTEPIHPQELAVVKQSLLARLRLSLDTAEEIAGYFAEDQLLDRPHSYRQNYLEAVSRVTAVEVQKVARKYLQPATFLFLIVGRWDEISAGAAPGASDLEREIGHPRTLLGARNPLTLEPVSED